MLRVLRLFLKLPLRKNGIAVFLSLCSLAIILSTAAVVTVQDVISCLVEKNVEKYRRPLYDILVRPKGAMLPVERKLGIVEGNFIQEGQNKISVEEYRKIASVKGVDIAAPVAPLGYVNNQYVNLEMLHPLEGTGDEIILESMNSIITDGLRKFTNYADKGVVNIDELTRSQPVTVGGKQYLSSGGFYPIFYSYVVGIDPKEEERLCGLREALVKGRYLNRDKPFYETSSREQTARPDTILIPALVSRSSYTNSYVELVEKLYTKDTLAKIPAEKIPPAGDGRRNIEIWNLFKPFKPYKVFSYRLSPREVVPFLPTHLVYVNSRWYRSDISLIYSSPQFRVPGEGIIKPYSEGDEVALGFSPGGGFLPTRIILTYPARYQVTKEVQAWPGIELTAIPDGKRSDDPFFLMKITFGELFPLFIDNQFLDDAPTYRNATVYRPPVELRIVPVGKIDLKKVAASNQTLENWVPLGMYIPPTTERVFDTKGNPTASVEIYPVDDPRMLLLNSPLGFVDWRAVARVRGKNCISAVRIRCESEDRIDEVVREIRKIGDYDINIVYGSSPQKVLVGDLDYQGARGIGYFVQLWTTLGASLKLKLMNQKFKTLLSILNILVLVALSFIYAIYYLNGLETERHLLRKVANPRVYGLLLYLSFALAPVIISGGALAGFACIFAAISRSFDVSSFLVSLSPYFLAFLLLSSLTVLASDRRTPLKGKPLLKRISVTGVTTLALRNELAAPLLFLSQIVVMAAANAAIVTTAASIYSIVRGYNLFILGEKIVRENMLNYLVLLVSAILMVSVSSAASAGIRASRYRTEVRFLKSIGWNKKDLLSYVSVVEIIIMSLGLFASLMAFLLVAGHLAVKDTFLVLAIALAGFLLPTSIHLISIRALRRNVVEI